MREVYGYDIPSEHTGECWPISAIEKGDCVITKGEYKGMTLSKLWDTHRELFGNLSFAKFPLLLKVIDARTDLSLQVHPDDEYVKRDCKGVYGKSECWYVLEAEKDATMIVGHNAKTKEELFEMIDNKRYDELVREVPVKKGDFIQVGAGVLHAIKGGVLILETQQSCDISYRLYDYDRLDKDGKPRPLHVKESKDVIAVPSPMDNVWATGDAPIEELVECKHYAVTKLTVKEKLEYPMDAPFRLISCIEGNGTIDGEPIKKGEHLLATSACDKLTFDGDMIIITSRPGKKYN